jgi:hypothetical protein
MIVLNAFSKGLVGALGALLCVVLFVVHEYNVSLWKRFFSFLKTNGRTHFGLTDLFLLGIINSLFHLDLNRLCRTMVQLVLLFCTGIHHHWKKYSELFQTSTNYVLL